MKHLIIFLVLIISSNNFASFNFGKCTTWKEKENYNCIFNNRNASIWIRQCMDNRDKTYFCSNQNPNSLISTCTNWIDQKGTTCSTGEGLAKKWIRSCTDIYSNLIFCSDKIDPNDLVSL